MVLKAEKLTWSERIRARLGVGQGDRRQGLAVCGRRYCSRRGHSRLCTRKCAGRHHGQAGLVVGAGCGATGSTALFQRSRGYSHRQRADGKRRLAWVRFWPS